MSINETEKNEQIERVANLVDQLKGDRSLRKFSEDTGVATSYINGIINKKYLPSANTLRKLSYNNAKGQNGITLEDLMIAAGYQVEYSNDNIEQSLEEREQRRKEIEEHRKEHARLERIAKLIVFDGVDKVTNHNYLSYEPERFCGRNYKPDFICAYNDDPDLLWWFDYIHVDNPRHISFMFRNAIGRICMLQPDNKRKVSIVLDDKEAYERIVKLGENISYRGNLSVILIDLEQALIIDEKYISHYYEDGHGNNIEIMLV